MSAGNTVSTSPTIRPQRLAMENLPNVSRKHGLHRLHSLRVSGPVGDGLHRLRLSCTKWIRHHWPQCIYNHSVFINIKVNCTSPQADALRAGLSFPVTRGVARVSKTYWPHVSKTYCPQDCKFILQHLILSACRFCFFIC